MRPPQDVHTCLTHISHQIFPQCTERAESRRGEHCTSTLEKSKVLAGLHSTSTLNLLQRNLCNCDTKEISFKTDDLEQRNRLENLRIFGIKEEAKEDTNQLVLDVAMKIGIYSLEKHHISRSHRVGKKHSDKPRAIIVKFVSYADRQKLFEAKKKLKGSNISIREDLTSIRQAILRKAHEKFEEVWTQNGVIVIKDGAKFHRIRTMEKLDELINSDE
ncbi:LINE-1 type transposase domain-containing protein 1 [Frankliniella fusca]|uniref:LINE-1 type transposase domain-containing protein 1 n=1 Tax=Frankliniella fusca TaxID=407009 RepID=A0AAE1LKJ6_9NEOP|nr:LINE-1 type transposase domain-containing protein 1 [Frankliniella fusca]